MNSNLTMLIIDTTNFRSLHDMYFGIHIPDELWEQTMTSIPYMKSIIVNIITHNPDICTFMFYDFNILQRNILYRTFFELSLPSIAVTSLVIPNSLFIRIDLNHNLRQHIYNYATNTANYLTHTNIIDNNNFRNSFTHFYYLKPYNYYNNNVRTRKLFTNCVWLLS